MEYTITPIVLDYGNIEPFVDLLIYPKLYKEKTSNQYAREKEQNVLLNVYYALGEKWLF